MLMPIKGQKGFTIVELLIVIVVIAILATISIVAYNGVQGRARDAKRQGDMSHIIKLLELYHADNGGYPICSGTGPYTAGGTVSSGGVTACLAGELVPAYAASLPVDPVNVAPRSYYYAVGYQKNGTNSYTGNQTDNYILGTNMDGGGTNYSGWGVTLNYLHGSSY
jgi:prepilin-type N-terminal cleavage/methylation domain-containing protein